MKKVGRYPSYDISTTVRRALDAYGDLYCIERAIPENFVRLPLNGDAVESFDLPDGTYVPVSGP